MAAGCVLVRVWWLILAVLHVDAASVPWLRDRSCLSAVVSIPAGQRKSVTVNGLTEPLRIAHGDWESAALLAWTSKVICEEVFGIHVEVIPLPSSVRLLYAVSDCKDPLSTVDKKCDHPGPPPAHAAVGVWRTVDGDALLANVKATNPGKYPLDLGSIGYDGHHVFFLQEASTEPAMRDHHLPLQYYLSYSHPQVDASAYFSRTREISTDDLMLCNETRLQSQLVGDLYVEQTGDTASVDRATGGVLCSDGYWWLSPACRRNTSTCIPFLTGGDGWEIQVAMQRATIWSIPLAVATTKDSVRYTMLPKQFRTITYWWFPDATFLSVNPVWMSFPPFNPEEWKRGRTTTDFKPDRVSKYAFRGMENRTNVRTARVLQFLRNLEYSYPQISDLLSLYASKPAGNASLEETVCEWLNNNTAVWESWIPVETNCMQGQGLADRQGAFVANRTAATGCSWCPPGRISTELIDTVGTTYRCQECNKGEFQGAMGMIECERCSPGTSAPRSGMAACDRCGFSEFTAEVGASQCQMCPQGFITPFEGAQSMDACVCPEGTYRGTADRGVCLPCEFGMHCPVGSDALGYLPEQAATYQVVPILEKGFWSSASEPLSIFRCEDVAHCPGRRTPGTCFDRLEGQACQHCSQGYVWGGDVCRECKREAIGYVLFPVLPCVALPLLVILMYKTSSDGYDKWGKWQAGIGALTFLLLHHSQLMKVIHRTDTAFTRPASGAMGTFGWVSDIWSMFNVGCYGFHTFSRMMLLRSLGPFFLIVGYALVWCGSQLVGRWYPPVKMEINRTINGLLSLIVSFFTAIADSAMTIFKCSKNPNNTHSLVSDRSVLCFQGEWSGLVVAGVASVLVWCVGVVLLFLYAIWTAGAQMHREAFRTRWKFLFIRYRNDVHWWALVIMIKGIVVNLGCVVLENGIGQICWILVVFLLYTHLATRCRPWRCVLNNVADVDLHFSLTLACAATIWFAKDERVAFIPDGTAWGENMVKVATYGPPAMWAPFALAIWWFNGSRHAKEKKRQDLQVVAESVELLARCSGTDLDKFLLHLSEADWLETLTFTSVVQTELGDRQSRRGYSSKMLPHKKLSGVRSILSGVRSTSSEPWGVQEAQNSPKNSVQAGEQPGADSVVLEVADKKDDEVVSKSEIRTAGEDTPSLPDVQAEASLAGTSQLGKLPPSMDEPLAAGSQKGSTGSPPAAGKPPLADRAAGGEPPNPRGRALPVEPVSGEAPSLGERAVVGEPSGAPEHCLPAERVDGEEPSTQAPPLLMEPLEPLQASTRTPSLLTDQAEPMPEETPRRSEEQGLAESLFEHLISFKVDVGANVGKLGFKPQSFPPDPVIVGEVRAGSWSAENGIRVGDALVAVNDVGMERLSIFDLDRYLTRERPLQLSFTRQSDSPSWNWLLDP